MTAGKPLYAEMKQAFDYAAVVDTAVQQAQLSNAEAASHFDALLQWLSIIPLSPKNQPVQMVESVDRLWHAFMLHTKLYRKFCDRFFGHYIDHDPLDRNDVEMSKKAYARLTLALLKQEFGDDVHPAFLDLTQKVSCCYGQCDDNGGGFALAGATESRAS